MKHVTNPPLSPLYTTGAQVFATCTAGDGGNSNLDFKSKLTKQKHGVQPGKNLAYGARIRNTAKEDLPSPLEFAVVLPQGINFLKANSKPKYRYILPNTTTTAGGKKLKNVLEDLLPLKNSLANIGLVNKTSPLRGQFNSTSHTLIFRDLTFPAKKDYLFFIKVRVLKNVPVGTNLFFSASIYERLPATGQPYCSSTNYVQSVEVVDKGVSSWSSKK
jgi:hypothetical protein